MTEYFLKKEDDLKNLKIAIEDYEPAHFKAIGTFEGTENIERININYSLEGKTLHVSNANGLLFATNQGILQLPLYDYKDGFTLQYQKFVKGSRLTRKISADNIHPNDKRMPKVDFSVFKNRIDGILLEISFFGKINLESLHEFKVENNPMTEYWKVIKKS